MTVSSCSGHCAGYLLTGMVVKVIALLFALVAMMASAQASSHGPQLQRVFHPLAKIQQAAVFDYGHEWLIRGRVTRTDNERWVPHGKIVATVAGRQFSGFYRPNHIDPKARRASYFSIRIPKQALTSGSGPVQLQYQAY